MIKKVAKIAFPILLGALGGYLYYYFIGCNNGCAITGSPVNSTAFGTVVGALFTNWKSGIKSLKNTGEENEKEHGND
jgi:hypothetical protein